MDYTAQLASFLSYHLKNNKISIFPKINFLYFNSIHAQIKIIFFTLIHQ